MTHTRACGPATGTPCKAPQEVTTRHSCFRTRLNRTAHGSPTPATAAQVHIRLGHHSGLRDGGEGAS